MSPAKRVQHEHGDHRRYDQGCRCDLCRRASSEQRRIRRHELAAYNVDGVAAASIKHGDSGYKNHHCRCDVCVNGHRVRVAQHRARRYAARELIGGRMVAVAAPRHGVPSTYNNYGCRCDECTDAATGDRTSPRSSA